MTSLAYNLLALVALLFCIIPHEVAHGLVALRLGDPTAKNARRLSLNPIRHLDPVGSVIIPLALLLLQRFAGFPPVIIGWAKPVPINPYYFSDPWKGMVWVGLAGPATNVLLALAAAGIGHLFFLLGLRNRWVLAFLALVVLLSLLLAFFNLIPIPPLDGSRVLTYFLPLRLKLRLIKLEQFGIIIVVVLMFLGVLEVVFRGANAVTLHLIGTDWAISTGLWI